MFELFANSGDPDQTASHLGLHCLPVFYGVMNITLYVFVGKLQKYEHFGWGGKKKKNFSGALPKVTITSLESD